MSDHVVASAADGVLTLTLDRPAKRNALTGAMYAALADAIAGASSDPAVRVVVLRGAGDMFTAGNDVAEFAAAGSGDALVDVVRFLQALARIDKPLVAGVQGRAVGIGTTMLLHCDHVVLAEDATLSAPFVGLGLVPEAASSLLLPARIGHVRAYAMFAMGDEVAAADAVGWGLANAAVPAATLDAAVDAVVRRLAALPPGALRATKRLMRDHAAITERMAAEGEEFARRLRSPEAREAFAAFAERRTPDFAQFG